MLRYYYVSHIPIYTTSAAVSSLSNANKELDLNGVRVCDIPKTNTNRFFAVGEDAYHLSQSLYRLQLLPQFPLYGATGALVLSPQHKIHRHIPCHIVQNG